MKKILFVAYGGGHIAMVLPVIRAIRKLDPSVHIDLIALTTAYESAKNAGENPRQYSDFHDLLEIQDKLFVESYIPSFTKHPSISDDEHRIYNAVNHLDLIEQHGQAEATAKIGKFGRYCYYPLSFFKRILKELSPDVVVTTNSPRSEEAALEAAMHLGIRTLSMTDLFALPEDPFRRRKRHADIVTVLSQNVYDTLANCGVPKDRLRVTGNPAFDGLRSSENVSKAKDFLEKQNWIGKKIILWAGHLDDYSSANPIISKATAYPKQVEAALRAWILNNEDYALIVRYHPNERQHFPQGECHPRIYNSTWSQHIHEAILASDAVVVQMSTVGLESAVANKPVVALVNSPSCLVANFNYQALGIAYAANSIEELPAVIEHALIAGCTAKGLITSGESARLIANEIEKLLL